MARPLDEPTLRAFLSWLRRTSEHWWQVHGAESFGDWSGGWGECWKRGSRWTSGVSAPQLRAFGAAYGVTFPASYALFLRELGHVVPCQFAARWADDVQVEEPGGRVPFTDWADAAQVRTGLRWPLEWLWSDVQHNRLWLPEWGPKPVTEAARLARLSALVQAAPTLLPVYGHRFVVAAPAWPQGVVLSVMGPDIIVYGANLPLYLMAELSFLAQADPAGFRQWQQMYAAPIPPDQAYADLPFWGPLLN